MFDRKKLIVETVTVGDRKVAYRAYEGIVYVTNPVDPPYQKSEFLRSCLIEHFQHDGIGCRLPIERYGQVCPYYERHPIGGIITYEGVIARHLAAVEIQRVVSEAQLGDAIAVLAGRGACSDPPAAATSPYRSVCE